MLRQQPILILEDEAFVAVDLAMTVEDMDGVVVGPAATVAEGLALLDSNPVAGAILDARLADRDVTPVALLLKDKGIPFVVHSGTGLPSALASVHPDLTVIRKPVPPSVVVACLVDQIQDPNR